MSGETRKRLMRFRVLAEHLIVSRIHLPRGDYDGEISWSERSFRGQIERTSGPSTILVAHEVLEAFGQPITPGILSVSIDVSAAVKRGDVVVL
jgi:hypothetical protein